MTSKSVAPDWQIMIMRGLMALINYHITATGNLLLSIDGRQVYYTVAGRMTWYVWYSHGLDPFFNLNHFCIERIVFCSHWPPCKLL